MLKHVSKIAAISILLFVFQQAHAALVTSGSVYLKAEPGSWVGGGIGSDEVIWTHGIEGLFSITGNFDKGASVTFDDGNFWSFDFAAPTFDPINNTNDGNRLEVAFYDNATRYPFNSPTRPGMDFSGNGRGNNTLGAWFDVREITYGSNDDEVLRLAVDFRQFDESEEMLGPSTFGSLRINSSIPLNFTGQPVPIPAAAWLFASGLLGLIGIARKRAAH